MKKILLAAALTQVMFTGTASATTFDAQYCEDIGKVAVAVTVLQQGEVSKEQAMPFITAMVTEYGYHGDAVDTYVNGIVNAVYDLGILPTEEQRETFAMMVGGKIMKECKVAFN